jgi:hypothetical protein
MLCESERKGWRGYPNADWQIDCGQFSWELQPRGREEQIMLRLVGLFFISLTMFSAFGQSTSKYQVGTITEVKVHQAAGSGAFGTASYDVSVKVGDTVYVVLYTPALGEQTVKYAAGRDLLVLVGKSTITYNDILGQSHDVPIESQKPAAKTKQSK